MLTYKKIDEHIYEIRVEMPDFLGLLSVVTGLFASAGIDILKGDVGTVNRQAMDTFEVLVPPGVSLETLKKDLETFAGWVKNGRMKDVKTELNSRLIASLRRHKSVLSETLYPVELNVHQEESPTETLIDIEGQETPAFLYELTNALSLLGINIVRMEILSQDGRVKDRLWVTNESGQKVTSERQLKALKWAVLLIKQFTHLLPRVPDPAQALDDVVLLGKHLFEEKNFDRILLKLKRSQALEDLSQMLGSSQFMWEEFVRLQHASLYQILGDPKKLARRKSRALMAKELKALLARQKSFDGKSDAANDYKDRELFRIDLRHLLGKTSYLEEFAEEFSDLAEVVITEAYAICLKEAAKKHPAPKVSARKASESGVFALGKFGGRELGYASDLELMVIYEDASDSSSEQSQKNLAFYTDAVGFLTSFIRAKREGVFEIDLRLRPYGEKGHVAVSLDLFKSYYSSPGSSGETSGIRAWNFERQAMVKLRPIAAPKWLADEVMLHRDRFVYGAEPFDFKEALTLRQKQIQELVIPGAFNAKYSPGGLLDIEYLTQAIQIVYGRRAGGDARNSNTLKALKALAGLSDVNPKRFEGLIESYVYLRDLINALRIFRGNAKDLTIPRMDSDEFRVLARRMGYVGSDDVVEDHFRKELERVIHHVETLTREWMRHLEESVSDVSAAAPRVSRTVLPKVNLSSLIRGRLSDSDIQALEGMGFQTIPEVLSRFRFLAQTCPDMNLYKKVMGTSWPEWQRIGDPDLAIGAWERLMDSHPRRMLIWKHLNEKPDALGELLALLGSSTYLAEILMRDSDAWAWLGEPKMRDLDVLSKEIKSGNRTVGDITSLRLYRHRLTLRIVMAELFGREDLSRVYAVYSDLADEVLKEVARHVFGEKPVGIIGLGKLGGSELNFSSDVDLMFVTEDVKDASLTSDIQRFVATLTEGGLEDFLFRVDLRLRPHGNHGSLFLSPSQYLDYYRNDCDVWEKQMLIKARAVTSGIKAAALLEKNLRTWLYGHRFDAAEFKRLQEIKRLYESQTRKKGEERSHVKLGVGGIRDCEFSAQILQLKSAGTKNPVDAGSTLAAYPALVTRKLLAEEDAEILKQGYLFMRRIENRLQLLENRQTFTLPKDKRLLRRLARSLGIQDDESTKAEDIFGGRYDQIRSANRAVFERIFFEKR